MNVNDLPTSDPEGTIPVAEATRLTANWRAYLQVSKQAFATHAFLLPIIDFKNILQYNPDAEGIRAYIGLDDANDPTSAKMILVPVVNGQDVCYLPKPPGASLGDDDDDTSNTYDVSTTCPPECPDKSPLNGG
ncbi:MAG TPA: hypothetical protein VL490_10110 [Mucilaginibacter sp.]|jgi:hypothetical protein|nr:hypothetical protein [Mucilaginibacter sp.]